MVVGFTITYAISAYIATNVMSSNPARAKVYSIRHYIIDKVCQWLAAIYLGPKNLDTF